MTNEQALRKALEYYANDEHYDGGDVPGHIYVLDDHGRTARAALSSLATPHAQEPVAATRAWAVKLANWRRGQSSTPRCEPPSERDIEWALKDIKAVLAASPPLYVALATPSGRAQGEGINCEEIAITHGQQVSITFKDKRDAFALFDELNARAIRLATPPSVPAQQGWLPIETAPVDGTEIMLAIPKITGGYFVHIGWYNKNDAFPWRFIDTFSTEPHGCCEDEDDDRTPVNGARYDARMLWQPLPDAPATPPSQDQKGEEGL